MKRQSCPPVTFSESELSAIRPKSLEHYMEVQCSWIESEMLDRSDKSNAAIVSFILENNNSLRFRQFYATEFPDRMLTTGSS